VATTGMTVDAPPERVFAVLADPKTYADWVVGSDTIRDADPTWPAPGSRFYHRVGVGPIKVKDHTEVLEADRPRKLALHARARPLGTAGDTLSKLAINPLTDWLVHHRNVESLRRLKRIAETGVVKP
jgi:uncharacterized protein YndB with AHSA1/START domain